MKKPTALLLACLLAACSPNSPGDSVNPPTVASQDTASGLLHPGSTATPQPQDTAEEQPVMTKPLLYVGSVMFPPTQTDLGETQQDDIVVLMSRRLPLKYSGKLTNSTARMELVGIVGRDDQSPASRRKARLRAAAVRAYVLQAYEALRDACTYYPQTISTVCLAADSAYYAGDSLAAHRVDFVYYPEPPASTR